jgi:TonB family protein
MKRIIILIIICFKAIICLPQEIRYVNETGFEVKKDEAKFFQELYKDSIYKNSIMIKKFRTSGELVEIGFYDKTDLRTKNGLCKEFDGNGNIEYIKTYKNNKLNGKLVGYYKSGQIRRIEDYRNDTLLAGKCLSSHGTDTAFFPKAILPSFKGGGCFDVRFFVEKNLDYPKDAYKQGIEGDVYVYFCIDRNNEICDIKITHSDNELFNEESIRVLKESARYWKAGYSEGDLAKMSLVIPIFYRLK